MKFRARGVYFRRPIVWFTIIGGRAPVRASLERYSSVTEENPNVRRKSIWRVTGEGAARREAGEGGVHDTGNLWHAISRRMKTWCRHVDLTGATQTFRLFHQVLHGMGSLQPFSPLFLSDEKSDPSFTRTCGRARELLRIKSHSRMKIIRAYDILRRVCSAAIRRQK